MQESEKRLNTKVLTVHEPVHNLSQSEQVAKLPESKLMACRNDLAKSRISRLYVQANYEADKTIQKIIKLVKERNAAVISRLPPPWREKFNAFSIDNQGLLYMDHRLVIPKNMQENLLRAIHFGHAGRDSMLREAAGVWWPHIHREIVEKAEKCSECSKAGKTLKCFHSRKT